MRRPRWRRSCASTRSADSRRPTRWHAPRCSSARPTQRSSPGSRFRSTEVATLPERPVRIGFLGCGMVAEMHRAAIERTAAAELVGVFDPAPTHARAWAVESYPSAAAMLADDAVEAVFVL